MRLFLFMATACSVVYAGAEDEWGYKESNGPIHWTGLCQTGLQQSPIDIHMKDVDYALIHRLHFLHYDHAGTINITNNGHSIQAGGFDLWGQKQPYIQGGGLKHRYKLVQFHLHWGSHDHAGSEHKIGGLHYPAELHLVHVRSDLTVKQAIERTDGLAVIAVFVIIGHDSSPLSSFSDLLPNVVETRSSAMVLGFKARPLLPYHTESFYRYSGSLTTPACHEAVIWTVLTEPITITHHQMKALRQIKGTDGSVLSKNYRHTHPLNGRKILYRPPSFDQKMLCPSTSTSATQVLLVVVFSLLSLL